MLMPYSNLGCALRTPTRGPPMLNHLRQRIAETLAPVRSATLATDGPAGLLAHLLPCAASGTLLYLLVPRTSDHLFNLESHPSVVVATLGWQVHGCARFL